MCKRIDVLSLHQVSPQEMVQEIHQVLMDREDTCHRTCFSLQLDGNVLDNFAELKSIEGLQEGSQLKVVEGESLFCFPLRFNTTAAQHCTRGKDGTKNVKGNHDQCSGPAGDVF